MVRRRVPDVRDRALFLVGYIFTLPEPKVITLNSSRVSFS